MRVSTQLFCGLALVALLAASACGRPTGSSGAGAQPTITAPGILPAVAQSAFQFAPGYVASDQIAPAQNGGVWVWGEDSKNATAFLVQSGRPVQSWTVGSPAEGIRLGALSGLTTTPDGDVWLGSEQTLIKLDPATGAVRSWPIPALPVDPRASAAQPAPLEKVEEVEQLATMPSGNVVIALTRATELAVFNPSTTVFSNIPIGTTGDVAGVAVSANGTIAVAVNTYTSSGALVLVQPGVSSTVQSLSTPALSVSADPTQFLLGTAGHISLRTASVTSTTISVVPQSSGIVFNPKVAVESLPGGRLVGLTGDSVAVITPSSGTGKKFDFPKVLCNPPGGAVPPAPPGIPSPSPQFCAVGGVALKVSGTGSVYFLTADQPATVAYIPAGSL